MSALLKGSRLRLLGNLLAMMVAMMLVLATGAVGAAGAAGAVAPGPGWEVISVAEPTNFSTGDFG
jgi:hypothetical protein